MNIYETRRLLRNMTIHDIELRVAYYGRVSTDKKEQKTSIENQESYYEELIEKSRKWKFAGKYIDEGISGVQVKKREAFLNMIQDAESGKIDLIITKEISRFARNTLDSIQYTRQLLEYGTAVWFQNDNINTLDEDSELRLTIMAGIAQDESRKLSSRIRFGHSRSIERGVVMGNSMIYGYQKENGRLIVLEKEAEMVRDIFEKYAIGWTTSKIEGYLWEKGCRNHKGGKISRTVIGNIITNPKYKGYYVGNKVKIVDLFCKKQKFLPEEEWVMYKDDGSHVPSIVEEALWDRANRLFKERGDMIKSRRSSFKYENIYTGKIICEDDGCAYWMKQHSVRGKKDSSWVCSHKIKNGKDSCSSFPIKERELNQIAAQIINQICVGKDEILKKYLEIYKKKSNEKDDHKKEIEKIEQKLNRLKLKQEKILDYNLNSYISDQEFIRRNKEYEDQIVNLLEEKEAWMKVFQNKRTEKEEKIQLEKLLSAVGNFEGIFSDEISKEIINRIFEKILVKPVDKESARITFFIKKREAPVICEYRKEKESSQFFLKEKSCSDSFVLTI